jgi:hypothetical protein
MSPGSRTPRWPAGAPDAGETIGLELHLHRQVVLAPRPAPLLRAHLALDAGEGLDVVADLVREDVGLREIPRRAEAGTQLVVEGEVDVDLLIGRAVEGTHLALSDAAARARRIAKEHELRVA